MLLLVIVMLHMGVEICSARSRNGGWRPGRSGLQLQTCRKTEKLRNRLRHTPWCRPEGDLLYPGIRTGAAVRRSAPVAEPKDPVTPALRYLRGWRPFLPTGSENEWVPDRVHPGSPGRGRGGVASAVSSPDDLREPLHRCAKYALTRPLSAESIRANPIRSNCTVFPTSLATSGSQ